MKRISDVKVDNMSRFTQGNLLSDEILKEALNNALEKIDKLHSDIGENYASSKSDNNVYSYTDYAFGGWNQGFTTGLYWLAYEATGDEKYKQWAMTQVPWLYKKIEEKLGVNHHDMGFLYVPSCVAAYKITGDEQAKQAALKAADHLLSRFIPEGGYIQAWGDVGAQPRFIVDCMVNIPLLYWAFEVTGDKTYYDKAYSHARATIENIIREDASTYHTFFFNQDGTPDRGSTAQGASDDSCWSRGQAWIIAGLAYSYKYTKDEEMLELFEKVTNYYLNHLPEDFVPFWDLIFTDGDNEPRDSSSAAIAASGIIEMLPYIKDDKLKILYEGAVDKIVSSLFMNYSTKDTPKSNGLLLHAVYSKPANLGVDECNIWGCYYYMECLVRLIKGIKAYW